MAFTALNIVFAVFCFLSLGCGITYSVLISQLVHFIFQKLQEHLVTSKFSMLWAIGLAYIIPAVIGLLACVTRRTGVYLAHAILAIKAVVILAVLLMMGLASTKGTSGSNFCDSREGMCICHSSAETQLLEFFSCSEINWMVGIGMASNAMFFAGGAVTVISAILAFCVMHKMRKEQLAGQGGTVVNLPNVTRGQFGPNPYERFDK